MSVRIVAVIALVLAAANPTASASSAAEAAKHGGGGRGSFLGKKPRTWLFVADPGTFSGSPENKIYVDNLVANKPFPKGATSCPDARYGTIMGLPVAVVTTGIGPMASALCVYDIMEGFGPLVKDIIYSGTSGWSPQVGGILNSDACDEANSAGRVNRIGDVCVSPLSVNFDCREASWTMTAKGYVPDGGDQCVKPEQLFDASNEDLFGKCMFSDVTESQLALSDEIIAASTASGARNELPPRNAQVVANEEAYWGAMEAGTGVSYPPFDPAALPHVYGYTECAEIDSQYFWSGAPWDMVARSYVASTLRAGLPGNTADAKSVIAVSAMEAIGVSQGLERYYAKRPSLRRRVPFTSVRGMSNQAVQPVARQSPGSSVWVNGEEVAEDFVSGYRYAIESSSSVVLSALQARCRAAGGGAGKCSYSMSWGDGGARRK